MISLDIKSVTDEIFALTALRAAVTEGNGETPPVLTRDNLPSLRVLVRAAFATLAASLGPLVADASVEDGNPPAPRPYDDHQPVTLDIDLGLRAASLSGGTRLVLKRYLEHLLALSVLEKAYLPVDAATPPRPPCCCRRSPPSCLTTPQRPASPPATSDPGL